MFVVFFVVVAEADDNMQMMNGVSERRKIPSELINSGQSYLCISNKRDESYINKRHTSGKKYGKNAEQSKTPTRK